MNKVLMLTIATNGYDAIFADCLRSQHAYADQQGYRYLAITESPPWGISGTNSAWLKIPLMLRAMQKGYEWVFFVDGDCTIRDHAPPIESVQMPKKCIYVGLDFSHRINSGVIIVKTDRHAIRFFRKLLALADLPGRFIPRQDRNLYENGHFIFLGKNLPYLEILDQKWNNTTGQPMGEYIWHGGGRYHEKPRASTKPKSQRQAFLDRLKEGPRYLLLRRLARYYEGVYSF